MSSPVRSLFSIVYLTFSGHLELVTGGTLSTVTELLQVKFPKGEEFLVVDDDDASVDDDKE